jgi:hypothetical protein
MSLIWALVLVLGVAMPLAMAAALYRGAIAAGIARRVAVGVAAGFGATWCGWILASGLLARSGLYRSSDSRIPWLPVVLAGSLAFALAATRVPVVARILAEPGMPARLVAPQVFRVVGGTFVIAMALGELPALFALPAGLGDIAVGVAAPFVAWRLARGTGRRAAVRFSLLGLLDLVVAVTIGTLTGIEPARVIEVSPTAEVLGDLPLALIPTTVVPLAIALHVTLLARLRAPLPAPHALPAR